MNLDPYTSRRLQKLAQSGFTDVTLRAKTIKLLEGNTEVTFMILG